jgi:hypothetical protein
MKKILALTAIAAMVAGSAQAIPTLTLSDNDGHSTTYTDASGAIGFNTTVGNWQINLGGGVGGPPANNGGSATNPALDLGSYDVFLQLTQGAPVGSVLTITFTDDNLGPIASTFSHFVTGSGSSISAVFNLLVNGNVVDTITGLNGTNNVAINAGAGSTVSLQAVLTANANGATTSFDTGLNNAPDGGMTLAMLALGMTGLVFFARTRKTA